MRFKTLSEHTKKLALKENWKVRSIIFLKDGSKILSSNSKSFENSWDGPSRIVINPGWNPNHSDMRKWCVVELKNDEIDHVEEYAN